MSEENEGRDLAVDARVAVVTCAAYPQLYDDDLPLLPALAGLGVRGVPVVWSDPSVDYTSFDAVVIRSPWDYFERNAEFRAWLDARLAEGILLCNAGDILDWNYDKKYLLDLERAGVEVVPTITVARGDAPDVAALARSRGWDEIVIKPTISGNAFRTHRLRVDEVARYAAEIRAIVADRGLLVQPFLPEILTDGELSVLFFDGVFSHAVRKRAKAGDYRVQFTFGGTHEVVDLAPTLVEEARRSVLGAPSLPVYARVDGVIRDGRFVLMELEVFEPLLFLARHPEAPLRLARAIRGRVDARAR